VTSLSLLSNLLNNEEERSWSFIIVLWAWDNPVDLVQPCGLGQPCGLEETLWAWGNPLSLGQPCELGATL